MENFRFKISRCFEASIFEYVKILITFPRVIIVFVGFLSLQMGSGLRFWKQQSSNNVEDLYTPSNGKFIAERQSSFDLWPLNPDRFVPARTYNMREAALSIFALKNKTDILKLEYINELYNFNNFLTHDMIIKNRENVNVTFTFQDICLRYSGKCSYENNHIYLLKNAIIRERRDKLTFPRWKILRNTRSFYVGGLVGGVELVDNSDHIEQIRAIMLVFYVRRDGDYLDKSLDWENEFARHTESQFIQNKSSTFDVSYSLSRSLLFASDQFNAVKGAPKTAISIGILIFATSILCIGFIKSKSRYQIDFVNSKPFLGNCGLISAMMANATSVGCWGYFGGTFSGTLQVTSFLSIAVGLDDMFIMMRAWAQSNPASSVQERMVMSLKYSIHSITITSLTSCMCFAIGCTSNFKAIAILSFVLALTMAINYVYIITFYAACMYLAGVIEHVGLANSVLYFMNDFDKGENFNVMMNGRIARKHISTNKSVANLKETFDETNAKPHDELNEIWPQFTANQSNVNYKPSETTKAPKLPDSDVILETNDPLEFFIYNYYSKYLLNLHVRCMVLCIYALYIVLAIYGCVNTIIGLETDRVAPSGFHIKKYMEMEKEFFLTKGYQVEIIVNNPPDCTKFVNRKDLHAMVSSMEDTEYTLSSNATDFFLRDFEEFLENTDSSTSDSPQVWEASLYSWSTLSVQKQSMEADLKWVAVPGVLKRCSSCDKHLSAFRLRIGLQNIENTENQRRVLRMIRKLTQKYHSYNLTSYFFDWPWIEQYDSVTKMASLTILYAMICMFAIAFLFFQSAYCVFWTLFAVISIDVGVIGFMRFANVNLDFVSTIVIIMSIGLSVDYTAHIVHGFKTASGNGIGKVRIALGSLGWPVLQGALTTFLGVSPLLEGTYYSILVFGIITSLSIAFGMFHACVILPTALCLSQELQMFSVKLWKSRKIDIT